MYRDETTSPHALLSASFLSPAALTEQGLSRHAVRQFVARGALLRLRNGRYVGPDCPQPLQDAGRLGGRLDCVSLLELLGVFVRQRGGPLHIQIEAGSSRLPKRHRSITAHWRRSPSERAHLTADLIEALAQACRCQSPRDAVATLDSAWHLHLVDEAGIAEVFALLPDRYQALRPLLDPRAEAGSETLVRLMLRLLGCTVEIQVTIPGVGRVDLLVDGWLIVECDSRAHHDDWTQRKKDMRRDLAAAALGYTTVRPIAEDIFDTPEQILAALRETLRHRDTRTPPIRPTGGR
ncbi:MAG: hypothetical protein QM677_01200 [Microbacterium sp.]